MSLAPDSSCALMSPYAPGHVLALRDLFMCHFHRKKLLAMPIPTKPLLDSCKCSASAFTRFLQQLACVGLQISRPPLVRPALCRALCSALTSWACPPAREFPAFKARLAHIDVPGLLALPMCCAHSSWLQGRFWVNCRCLRLDETH